MRWMLLESAWMRNLKREGKIEKRLKFSLVKEIVLFCSRSATRDKSSERSKSAYEKTQMRKDYDKLVEQLDILRRSESKVKAADVVRTNL